MSIKASSNDIGCCFGLPLPHCLDICQYMAKVQEEAKQTVLFIVFSKSQKFIKRSGHTLENILVLYIMCAILSTYSRIGVIEEVWLTTYIR